MVPAVSEVKVSDVFPVDPPVSQVLDPCVRYCTVYVVAPLTTFHDKSAVLVVIFWARSPVGTTPPAAIQDAAINFDLILSPGCVPKPLVKLMPVLVRWQ